jgi:DNA gyrase subunit A
MLPVEEGSAEDPSEDPSTGPSHLAMVTSRGLIKKTPVAEFASIFKNGKKALNLRVGDRLKHVELLRPGDGIVIGAVDGNVIHVDGDAIRPQGRAASGVKSMAFRFDAKTRDDAAAERALGEDEDDAGEALPANVAGVAVVPARVVEALDLRNTANANANADAKGEDEDEKDDAAEGTGTTDGRESAREPMLFLLSNQGRGKRIRLATFSQQARAGKGKRAMGLAPGDALAAMCVTGMSPEWAAAEGEGDGGARGGEGGEGEAAGERGEHVIVGSQNGVLNRLDVESVRPQRGASAKGVAVMKLGEGDVVSVLTLLPAELAE